MSFLVKGEFLARRRDAPTFSEGETLEIPSSAVHRPLDSGNAATSGSAIWLLTRPLEGGHWLLRPCLPPNGSERIASSKIGSSWFVVKGTPKGKCSHAAQNVP